MKIKNPDRTCNIIGCKRCIHKGNYECWLRFMSKGQTHTLMQGETLIGCCKGQKKGNKPYSKNPKVKDDKK